MAQSNSYPRDPVIKDKDVFSGTQFSTLRTVNFTAQAVANYLNINGKISIGGQMTFKFVTLTPQAGTISFPLGGGDNTAFSAITNLIVSVDDMSTQNVVNFLSYIVGSEVLLAEQGNISTFGNYKIISYQVTDNPSFYTLELEYIGGYGNIKKDLYYDLVFFRETPVEGDKNFVFIQSVPSTVWNIEHNLNKFPSVSVVNINNIVMFGDVTYVDLNNLTIEFSAGFSGKAYMN